MRVRLTQAGDIQSGMRADLRFSLEVHSRFEANPNSPVPQCCCFGGNLAFQFGPQNA